MYALVVTQLDVDKPRVYPLDSASTITDARKHAKQLALYTALQMRVLGGKPEVWRIAGDSTEKWQLLQCGEVVVTIEVARSRSYPTAAIADTASQWCNIRYSERG